MKQNQLSVLFIIALIFALQGCDPETTGSTPTSSPLSVNLSWTSNRGEQQGFYIEESSDGNNFTQVQSVPDGVNSATVAVPSAGTYFFRMRGFNQAGNSPYTGVVSKQVSGS
jgi:hypothetical protein